MREPRTKKQLQELRVILREYHEAIDILQGKKKGILPSIALSHDNNIESLKQAAKRVNNEIESESSRELWDTDAMKEIFK